MQLPRISMAPVENAVGPGLARVSNAAGGLSETLQQGFSLLGQELVRTRAQEATLHLAKSLDKIDQDLGSREAFSEDELKQRLGADYSKVKDRVEQSPIAKVIDPGTGEEVERRLDIPKWMVVEELYDAEAQKAAQASAKQIGLGVGWQTAFERSAEAEIQGRKAKMFGPIFKEAGQYVAQNLTRQVLEAAWAGKYGPEVPPGKPGEVPPEDDLGIAGAMMRGGMRFLGGPASAELRRQVLIIKQTKPVEDALRMVTLPAYRQEGLAQLLKAQEALGDPERYRNLKPEQLTGMAREVQAALGAGRELVIKASGAKLAHEIAFASVDPSNPRVVNAAAAYDAVDAKVRANELDPTLAVETRKILGEIIADRTAASAQALNKAGGDAMAQFMALDSAGRPRMSFSNLLPSTVKELKTFGKDGEDILASLYKWGQGNEAHGRSMRQMPTEDESLREFRIRRSLALQPGAWRAMSGAEQTAVLDGRAEVPGEPDAPKVAVSSKDLPALGTKIAELSAPPGTTFVTPPSKIAFEEAEKKFPGLKGKRPSKETIAAYNLLTDRIAGFMNAEKNRTNKEPSEAEIRANAAKHLEDVEVRDMFLGIIPTTKKMPRVQADATGRTIVGGPAAPPAPVVPKKVRRTDPKTGETRVWNGSAWVKE